MPTEAPTSPTAAPAAASPPPAPAQSTPEMHVTTTSVTDRGPAPEPPKKGSAQQRMFEELRKRAGAKTETPAPKKDEPVTTDADTDEAAAAADKAADEPNAPASGPTEKPGEKKKLSPWKLVDEHKAARIKAETELAELRKTMVEPAKAKEIQEKYSAAEKRLQELEEQIRYVDYSKSQEFKQKYDEPYQNAWKKAMGDLGELTVSDPVSGQERPLEPKDILSLVNMDLRSARAKAVELYGDFADDVMAHRKEIRNLFEAQHNALEEARKGGAEREAQTMKERQERADSLRREITNVWSEANKQAAADERFGKFLKPIEGDEEANKRLAKGFELADKAFSISPLDPNLTQEQRAEVIRLHAAIRNRAAAFGRVAYQNHQLEAKIAALTEELNKFKNIQPGAGSQRTDKSAAPMSARDSVFAALRARAH